MDCFCHSKIRQTRSLPTRLTRNLLTENQKVDIKETWKFLESDIANHGIAIFLRIFDQNPKVKELFPFRDSWGDELLQHPMFINHANR